MKKASAFGVAGDSSSSAKNGTLPSDIGLYFLGSDLILLCKKCLGTATDNVLLGRGLSVTGKLDIPY
jgi:hypothetical protein